MLILSIRNTRSCQGISYQSFKMILIAYILRYWDIFVHPHSSYNILMKLLYLISVTYILYLLKHQYTQVESVKIQFCDYDIKQSFNYKKPYIMAGLLTIIINTNYFQVFELSWSYSKWLEALSIIPQIKYLQQIQFIESIDGYYLSVLCMNRLFYHISCFHYYYFNVYICYTSALAAILQTILLGILIKQQNDNKQQKSISV
ncbi:hypothetical protein pb186bvf_012288 [Paramecium bursaria]